MRSNAITAAVVTAVAIVGMGSVRVFADTNTNSASTAAVQNYVTVQLGDYLAKIAASNNTTYVRIYDANTQIASPDLIYPGEQLRIPSANEQLTDRLAVAQSTVIAPEVSDQDDNVVAPQPVAAVAPTPAAAAPTAAPAPAVASGSVWDEIAMCESSGNWAADTGNGFYGGLQFTLSSWEAVGGTGYPNQASREEQIALGEKLQAIQGWGAWPVCSRQVGL